MARVRDGTGINSITNIGGNTLMKSLRMAAIRSDGEALKHSERKIE